MEGHVYEKYGCDVDDVENLLVETAVIVEDGDEGSKIEGSKIPNLKDDEVFFKNSKRKIYDISARQLYPLPMLDFENVAKEPLDASREQLLADKDSFHDNEAVRNKALFTKWHAYVTDKFKGATMREANYHEFQDVLKVSIKSYGWSRIFDTQDWSKIAQGLRRLRAKTAKACGRTIFFREPKGRVVTHKNVNSDVNDSASAKLLGGKDDSFSMQLDGMDDADFDKFLGLDGSWDFLNAFDPFSNSSVQGTNGASQSSSQKSSNIGASIKVTDSTVSGAASISSTSASSSSVADAGTSNSSSSLVVGFPTGSMNNNKSLKRKRTPSPSSCSVDSSSVSLNSNSTFSQLRNIRKTSPYLSVIARAFKKSTPEPRLEILKGSNALLEGCDIKVVRSDPYYFSDFACRHMCCTTGNSTSTS